MLRAVPVPPAFFFLLFRFVYPKLEKLAVVIIIIIIFFISEELVGSLNR